MTPTVPLSQALTQAREIEALRAEVKTLRIAAARADGALVDTNDYTGVPKSLSVLATEYAARIAKLELALATHQCRHLGAQWCGKHKRYHGELCAVMEDAMSAKGRPLHEIDSLATELEAVPPTLIASCISGCHTMDGGPDGPALAAAAREWVANHFAVGGGRLIVLHGN